MNKNQQICACKGHKGHFLKKRIPLNYKYICKNRSYKDVSVLGVLKALYKKHKISKYQYKESINRVIHNQHLRNNVNNRLYFYLNSIRANTTKNTITAQHKKEQQNLRFIPLMFNNQRYSTFIKKKWFNKVLNNSQFNDDVYNEFKHLINKQNDVIVL